MESKSNFQDVGSERAVIASILQNYDLIIDAEAKLEETDFISDHHRSIYSVLSALFAQGVKSFDLMAVIDLAEKRKVLDSVGGPDYISALYSMDVDPRNFGVYIGLVLDASLKFKLWKEAGYIQKDVVKNLGAETGLPGVEVLALAEARLIDISMSVKGVEEAVNVGTDLRERIRELGEAPVDVRGLKTNIPLLDKALNGLSPGSLTVIAARQKGGKSTLMMNMASYMSYSLGIPVLYVDTEMVRREVQTRMLAHLSGVPERAIVNGTYFTDSIYNKRVDTAIGKIEGGLYLHKYYPGYTIEGLKSLVRKYHAREGIGAFFFDYIKIPELNGDNAFKEHQILGNVATALKDLAGSLDIPVISAAQIKRTETGTPKTHFNEMDVADSDRIGRYCNNLLALARKNPKEVEEDGRDCGTHRLQVLLARAGGTLYKGIDLDCHFPTLTMVQAQNQANGIPVFEGDSESKDGLSW